MTEGLGTERIGVLESEKCNIKSESDSFLCIVPQSLTIE